MRNLLVVLGLICGFLLGLASALAQEEEAAHAGVVRISAQRAGAPAEVVGSGVVIRLEQGAAYVLTAAHVVEGASTLRVLFHPGTGSAYGATLVDIEGGNPQGLALLKVEGSLRAGVRALPLAVEVELKPGDAVVAIGHSLEAGGDWSQVSGTVSRRRGRIVNVQAPVRLRNSGGPVMLRGRVVAIVLNEIGGFGEVLPAKAAFDFADGNRVRPEAGKLASEPVVAATTAPAAAPSAAKSAPAVGSQPATEPKPPPASRAAAQDSPASFPPGKSFRECTGCPEMIVLPAGSFLMGSPAGEKGRDSDEGPQHRVQVASIALGRTEVSFDEWDLCVSAGGCRHQPEAAWGRGSLPVMRVSWSDAKEYVAWLSSKTRQPYRLPSEAEWEYAARAGSQTPYAWGTDIGKNKTNCDGCGSRWDNKQTAPVASFPANAFGLYDMAGNVWEWVEDCWHDNYSGAPDKAWPAWQGSTCDRRVLRGGSWDDIPDDVRSASRNWFEAGNRSFNSGFRVARTLP